MSGGKWDANEIRFAITLALEYSSNRPEDKDKLINTFNYVKNGLAAKGIIKSDKSIRNCLFNPKNCMRNANEQSDSSTKSEEQKRVQNRVCVDVASGRNGQTEAIPSSGTSKSNSSSKEIEVPTQMQPLPEQTKHEDDRKSKQSQQYQTMGSQCEGVTSLQGSQNKAQVVRSKHEKNKSKLSPENQLETTIRDNGEGGAPDVYKSEDKGLKSKESKATLSPTKSKFQETEVTSSIGNGKNVINSTIKEETCEVSAQETSRPIKVEGSNENTVIEKGNIIPVMASADSALMKQKKPLRENEIPETKKRHTRSTSFTNTDSSMFDVENNAIEGDKGPKKSKRTYNTQQSVKKQKLCIPDVSNSKGFAGAIGEQPKPTSSQMTTEKADSFKDMNGNADTAVKEKSVNECGKTTLVTTPKPEKLVHVQKISLRSQRNSRSASSSNSSEIEIAKKSDEDYETAEVTTLKPKEVAESSEKKQKSCKNYDTSHKGADEDKWVHTGEPAQSMNSQQTNTEKAHPKKYENKSLYISKEDAHVSTKNTITSPKLEQNVNGQKISERSRRSSKSASNSDNAKLDVAKTKSKGADEDKLVNTGDPAQAVTSQQTNTEEAHPKKYENKSLYISKEDTHVSTKKAITSPKLEQQVNVQTIAERPRRSSRSASNSDNAKLDLEKTKSKGSGSKVKDVMNQPEDTQNIHSYETIEAKKHSVGELGEIKIDKKENSPKEPRRNKRTLKTASKPTNTADSDIKVCGNLDHESGTNDSTKHIVKADVLMPMEGSESQQSNRITMPTSTTPNNGEATVTDHNVNKTGDKLTKSKISTIHDQADVKKQKLTRAAKLTCATPSKNSPLLVETNGNKLEENNNNKESVNSAEILQNTQIKAECQISSQSDESITVKTDVDCANTQPALQATAQRVSENPKNLEQPMKTEFNEEPVALKEPSRRQAYLNHRKKLCRRKKRDLLAKQRAVQGQSSFQPGMRPLNPPRPIFRPPHFRPPFHWQQPNYGMLPRQCPRWFQSLPTCQCPSVLPYWEPPHSAFPRKILFKRPYGEKVEPVQSSVNSEPKKRRSITVEKFTEMPLASELAPINPPDFNSSVKEENNVLQLPEPPTFKRIRLTLPTPTPSTPQAPPPCSVEDVLPIFDSAEPSKIQEHPVSSPSPPVIQDAELVNPRRPSSETEPSLSFILPNDGSETISGSHIDSAPQGDYPVLSSSLGTLCPFSPPLSPSMVYPDTPKSSKQAMSPTGEEKGFPLNEALVTAVAEKMTPIVAKMVDNSIRRVEEMLQKRDDEFLQRFGTLLETLKPRPPPNSQ